MDDVSARLRKAIGKEITVAVSTEHRAHGTLLDFDDEYITVGFRGGTDAKPYVRTFTRARTLYFQIGGEAPPLKTE